MKWFYKLRMAYKILLPVSVTLVVVLALMAWQIQSKGSEIIQKVAERELVALGGVYSAEVHRFINLALNSAIETSNTIVTFEESSDSVPLSRVQTIDLLKSLLNSGHVLSSAILMLPMPDDAQYANISGNDANGQFYPYVSNAGVTLVEKGEFKSDYFTIPQNTKKPYISDPYLYPIDGKDTLIITVSAPIIVNNVFKGVVALDFGLDLLAKMAKEVKVYTTGGTSVFSQSGVFMSHRDPKYVLKNIFDSERWRNNQEFKRAVKDGKPYVTLIERYNVKNFYYFHPFKFSQTDQIMYFIVVAPADEVLAEVAQLTDITLIISAFALIVLLSVIFMGVRSSIKPLAIMAVAADEVAKGNYEVKIDARTFGGEIINLKNSLDTMVGSLVENMNKAKALSEDAQVQTLKAQEATREADAARLEAEGAKKAGMLVAAEQLESVVSIVSIASEKLSSKIEESGIASVRQAERVSETATAMEEMNSTVLEVAQSAGLASEISTQTRTCAEAGTRIVHDAVVGIKAVQNVSLALKEDMNVLSAKANAISEIMNVISDIADQTNLLALNAAIEAARAGEAGRGFAVVADEVRKLAEKTMASTTDVGNAIQSIQASVNTSISQVDKAVELIGLATEQSNQSGESLNEIVVLVDTTADQVRSIATASEEQSATSEEINRAISEINELTEQSAQGMREAASAVNDLTAQTHTLSKLIEDMKQG